MRRDATARAELPSVCFSTTPSAQSRTGPQHQTAVWPLLIVALLFLIRPALAEEINLPIYKQVEESRIYYIVPGAKHPMASGYINPCTQQAFVGLPITYEAVAVVPADMRDRLAEPSYARGIIEKAAAKFQEICPEAKMYSTGGPTTGMFSDMNKNKLNIYILMYQEKKLVPYSSKFGSSYEQQYAVRAYFQPSDPPSPRWTWAREEMENRPQREPEERRREADRIRKEQEEKQRQAALADEARRKIEDEKRRVVEAEENYQRKIQDSRATYDDFNNRSRISDWPESRDLLRNVSNLQGKVIGIRAKAYPAANDPSVFAIDGGLLYVAGAPSPLSKAATPTLIAGKVIGTKKIDLVGAPVSVPQLDYIDAHPCKSADCEDVMFWMNPKRP